MINEKCDCIQFKRDMSVADKKKKTIADIKVSILNKLNKLHCLVVFSLASLNYQLQEKEKKMDLN